MHASIQKQTQAPINVANSTNDNFQTAKVWLGRSIKASLCLGAGVIISRLMYQNMYSPTRASFSEDKSTLHDLYDKYDGGCDSTMDRAQSAFFNAFEAPLFSIDPNNPPKDLKAFLLDGNLKGASCAYDRYDGSITQPMKDRLLGLLLERMDINHQDLKESLLWLIDKGASPNYPYFTVQKADGHKKKLYHHALLTAFRSDDLDLFEKLLSKGAKVDQRVYVVKKSYQQPEPIIKTIVDEIAAKPSPNSKECRKYKKFVDLSIDAHQGDLHSYGHLYAKEFKELIYKTIGQNVCHRSFPYNPEFVSQEANSNIFSNMWENGEIYLKVLKSFFDDFWAGMTQEEQKSAYQMLNLDKDELSKMSKKEASKAIRSACRKLHKEYHPDKNQGEQKKYEELFNKVTDACDELQKDHVKGA